MKPGCSAGATRSSGSLAKLAPKAILITDEEGRRTFETDALTAYRCLPLAVVLPSSTEEVSELLRYCHDTRSRWCRAAPVRRSSGGALPLEDSIVLGLSRMTRVLAMDEANRVATGRSRHHQSRHFQCRSGPRLLLCA